MAMLGCWLIGLDNPSHPDQIKTFVVYVEMDRCTADAVADQRFRFWLLSKNVSF
jgi:formylmethanofuran dehydrogenase subunit E